MLSDDNWSGIECVKWNVQSVIQSCSHTPANARAFWTAFATGFWGSSFQIFCNVVRITAFCLAFNVFRLAWRGVAFAPRFWRLSSKFFFQWNFMHDAQQLAFKIDQAKTNTFFYKFNLKQWRHTDIVFRQVVSRFLSMSTGMQILMLELCWRHFNKLALDCKYRHIFSKLGTFM